MGAGVSTKSEIVVPRSVRRRAGIKKGQRVQFKVSGGVISIVPELPRADDEYTPAQRRIIDARLREARRGLYYGPFDSADEMLASLKQKTPKARRSKRRK